MINPGANGMGCRHCNAIQAIEIYIAGQLTTASILSAEILPALLQ